MILEDNIENIINKYDMNDQTGLALSNLPLWLSDQTGLALS